MEMGFLVEYFTEGVADLTGTSGPPCGKPFHKTGELRDDYPRFELPSKAARRRDELEQERLRRQYPKRPVLPDYKDNGGAWAGRVDFQIQVGGVSDLWSLIDVTWKDKFRNWYGFGSVPDSRDRWRLLPEPSKKGSGEPHEVYLSCVSPNGMGFNNLDRVAYDRVIDVIRRSGGGACTVEDIFYCVKTSRIYSAVFAMRNEDRCKLPSLVFGCDFRREPCGLLRTRLLGRDLRNGLALDTPVVFRSSRQP